MTSRGWVNVGAAAAWPAIAIAAACLAGALPPECLWIVDGLCVLTGYAFTMAMLAERFSRVRRDSSSTAPGCNSHVGACRRRRT
jgi:hypothetical protein